MSRRFADKASFDGEDADRVVLSRLRSALPAWWVGYLRRRRCQSLTSYPSGTYDWCCGRSRSSSQQRMTRTIEGRSSSIAPASLLGGWVIVIGILPPARPVPGEEAPSSVARLVESHPSVFAGDPDLSLIGLRSRCCIGLSSKRIPAPLPSTSVPSCAPTEPGSSPHRAAWSCSTDPVRTCRRQRRRRVIHQRSCGPANLVMGYGCCDERSRGSAQNG